MRRVDVCCPGILQGGNYNQNNVDQYQASLDGMDEYMRNTQGAQTAKLNELKADIIKQVCSAYAFVLHMHDASSDVHGMIRTPC